MYSNSENYYREKSQALAHLLIVIFITAATFVFTGIIEHHNGKHLFILKLMLSGLSILSFTYYVFIVKYPNTLQNARKFLRIVADVFMLTWSIFILKESGLFLLPLYILIVMESGVYFGLFFFYLSVVSSSVSWVVLVSFSTYWQNHSDIIAVFALTTFLVPLGYLKRLLSLHEKQAHLNETLKHSTYDANYDALTGLANRKYYERYIQQVIKERVFFGLLFIDLNKFKAINDTYGHDVGDEVLIEVAKRLKNSIDKDDMLARLGGDEFVIISKRKKVFFPKFIENLEQTTIGNHRIGKVTVKIELSIGISFYPDDSKTETFLRKCADEAMYEAKKRPKQYHVFYQDLHKKIPQTPFL